MPEIVGHDFPEYVHREWPKWVNGVLCDNETDAEAAGAPAEAVETPAAEPAPEGEPVAETPVGEATEGA